jgi:hypothetical protein
MLRSVVIVRAKRRVMVSASINVAGRFGDHLAGHKAECAHFPTLRGYDSLSRGGAA